MYDRDDYSKIADTKKGICIDNNINLIDLYPRDFKNKKEEDLYEMLMQNIIQYKEGEINGKKNSI